MKLQNNIVSDSEMEITFDSFNPTAGRLADCLLGFSIQVQPTLALALSRHTQGHRGTKQADVRTRPQACTRDPPATAATAWGRRRPAGQQGGGPAGQATTPTRAPSGSREGMPRWRALLPRSPGRNRKCSGRSIVATAEAQASGWYIWAPCIFGPQAEAQVFSSLVYLGHNLHCIGPKYS